MKPNLILKQALYHTVVFLLLFFAFALSGCSGLVTNTFITPAVDNLQKQRDLDLVCEGAPAYLLMIDSMIEDNQNDETLLLIGTKSYTGYITALQECGTIKKRFANLTDKAHIYGKRLLQTVIELDGDQDHLLLQLKKKDKDDVPTLFWGCLGWLSWVQQQKGAPAAMADLAVIEQVMMRILELDPGFEAGSPHLFMGSYLAAKPQMLGGNLEKAKHHFEQAITLSNGRFLLAQVNYAELYARKIFDKELHDRLLNKVLAFDLDSAPDHMLSNQVAVRKAKKLLADDYFLE